MHALQLLKVTPFTRVDGLSIRAVPKGLLHRAEHPWPDPPFSPAPAHWPGNVRVNMSFRKLTSKTLSKSAVVRVRLGSKCKTAISLIVTRGADVERDAKGRERIVFREEDAGAHWIMPDWTYAVQPTLEVYRMPYQKLIPQLRRALTAINDYARKLEARWIRFGKVPPASTKSSPESSVITAVEKALETVPMSRAPKTQAQPTTIQPSTKTTPSWTRPPTSTFPLPSGSTPRSEMLKSSHIPPITRAPKRPPVPLSPPTPDRDILHRLANSSHPATEHALEPEQEPAFAHIDVRAAWDDLLADAPAAPLVTEDAFESITDSQREAVASVRAILTRAADIEELDAPVLRAQGDRRRRDAREVDEPVALCGPFARGSRRPPRSLCPRRRLRDMRPHPTRPSAISGSKSRALVRSRSTLRSRRDPQSRLVLS
ncbi:hypothetical protein A0H81_03384 [Grifola frondosa]|uniref:Uncharacterized protein n=1 Tax=Grifola frondosa TaxID=5627 RepID=A0A1C7MJ59_GRIFR|nr:hypothetical protein A0H81_03384 [Grifola frondosa]